MRKTFKYRLLGSKTTFANAERWLDLCRNLYNAGLEQRIIAYKSNKVSISGYEQMNELPELRTTFPEYKNVDAQVLQNVLERLNKTYRSFFQRLTNSRGKVGFPRFKSSNRYNSFTMKQTGWKLDDNHLLIKRIGMFKLRLSRPIEGIIKTVTICRRINKWYVCFSCDNVPKHQLPISDKVIGLDVGIKSIVADSDGGKIGNPAYYRNALKLLRIRQRRLCRRARGSNHRQQARTSVARTHEKIKNQRSDFLYKLVSYYIHNYGTIVVETLNIQGMAGNHHLAKSILDSGWGEFIRLLEYKAEEAGRQVVKIPMFEPTSKTCSECGAINRELKLSDRQWVCRSCGALHDRDFNAAKNILRVGQTLQAQTCASRQSVACKSQLYDKGVSRRDACLLYHATDTGRRITGWSEVGSVENESG